MIFSVPALDKIRHVFQYVARLAVQLAADSFERAESYAFHFSGFEKRKVGDRYADSRRQFSQRYFLLHQHEIENYPNSHGMIWLMIFHETINPLCLT